MWIPLYNTNYTISNVCNRNTICVQLYCCFNENIDNNKL